MTPHLETERLCLTVLTARDAPLLWRYVNDNRQHLAQWEPRRDEHYYTLEACQDRLFTCYQHWLRGEALPLVALDRQRGQMVASCNASQIVRGVFQACYLGYSVDAAHQGQGLMREAVGACVDYLFIQMRLHRIMANYLPHNQRSAHLLAALGFQQEGVAKSYLKIDGRWQDHVLTALTNPEPV